MTDAQDWIEGRDPFAIRSNRSIAVEFAKAYPGQSDDAVVHRIARKLRKRREEAVLVYALSIAYEREPYATTKRISKLMHDKGMPIWSELWENVQEVERSYIAAFGKPDPQLSFKALDEELEATPPIIKSGLLHRMGS